MTVRSVIARWRPWILLLIRSTAGGSFVGGALDRLVIYRDGQPSNLVMAVLLLECVVSHAFLVREGRRVRSAQIRRRHEP